MANEKHRPMLCLLSVFFACVVTGISGAYGPAAKLLHQWYVGVAAIFVLIFAALMVFALRGRLNNSYWIVPASAALSYPAASAAYVIYFSIFEPQRLLNGISRIDVLEAIAVVFLIVPTVSFAWLFGVSAGAAFILLQRARWLFGAQFL
jgi:hypothetical protein